MRFTHAHTPAALCAPTRYALLSGNYPWRGRAPGGTWGYNVPSQFKPGQQSVAQLLKPAGYRCAMFGKAGTGGYWGMQPGAKPAQTPAPVEWGFDHSLLIPRGHQSPPLAFFRDGISLSPITAGRAADWDHSKVGARLLADAVAFLETHAKEHPDQPFYLHFCSDGAHAPYVPAETLAGKKLKGVTGMTHHTDMVHEPDILLGELVATLDRLGLRKNTLIIYTSDNGGLPFERAQGHDAVAGLRGNKSTIFEGGTRVPFVAAWPERIAAGTTYAFPVGTHDLVATALDLAGLAKPAGQALDSVSLKPVLLGTQPKDQPIRQFLLTQSSPGRGPTVDNGFRAGQPQAGKRPPPKPGGPMAFAVYQGDWKLILGPAGKPAALYNLATDLAEEKNLLASEPARAATLAAEFKRIRNRNP
jgi:arylsulfatase A-like enzyme